MPPKNKLKQPKPKTENSVSKNTNKDNPTENTNIIPAEVQEQFELELCWCIQQLQVTINSGKLNEKQMVENTKVLNTLMNNSSSFIKKRQLMRVTFGDYRAKMLEESKKNKGKTMNMKIGPSAPSEKSQFVKKSADKAPSKEIQVTTRESILGSSSGSNFKFNFVVEET